MVLAILMIGAGVLAMAAGPEPRVPAIDSVEGAPTPAGQASNDSP